MRHRDSARLLASQSVAATQRLLLVIWLVTQSGVYAAPANDPSRPIPLCAVVDQTAGAPKGWEEALSDDVRAVSHAFQEWCGIEFALRQTRTWQRPLGVAPAHPAVRAYLQDAGIELPPGIVLFVMGNAPADPEPTDPLRAMIHGPVGRPFCGEQVVEAYWQLGEAQRRRYLALVLARAFGAFPMQSVDAPTPEEPLELQLSDPNRRVLQLTRDAPVWEGPEALGEAREGALTDLCARSTQPGCVNPVVSAYLAEADSRHSLIIASRALRLDPANVVGRCMVILWGTADAKGRIAQLRELAGLAGADSPTAAGYVRDVLGREIWNYDEEARAGEEFRAALKACPCGPIASDLAAWYGRTKQYEEARATLAPFITRPPKSASATLTLVEIATAQDRFGEAQSVLDGLVEDLPLCAGTWLARGRWQYDRCNEIVHAEDYSKAVMARIRPGLTAATDDLRRAVELDPRLAEAHYLLGVCLPLQEADRKGVADAIRHLEECIRVDGPERAFAARAEDALKELKSVAAAMEQGLAPPADTAPGQ